MIYASNDYGSAIFLLAAASSLQFPKVLAGPDTIIQPVNMTEAESSGGADSLNCTCNDITCSNCGLVFNLTNLLTDVTTIQFFEQVKSADGEGKRYPVLSTDRSEDNNFQYWCK